jgi:hypothetical protein
MYRRYRDYRQRRRRRNTDTARRPRSVLKRPGVQISILLIVALIIYLILQSGGAGGNSLPHEIGMEGAYAKYLSNAIVPGIHTVGVWHQLSDIPMLL